MNPFIRLAFIALALIGIAVPAVARPLEVVASFSIVGDMVQRVAGDRARVTTLVGPDADAHVFQAGPSEARVVASARLFFVNGLGYDGWTRRLLVSTGSKATLVTVSAGVNPLDRGKGHADPHAWQDVTNAMIYVRNIAAALSAADPQNAAAYTASAKLYLGELESLDVSIRDGIRQVPQGSRRVITTHDAFGYFAQAYGVTFLAPLGISTEEQASAKGVAKLISQIRREKVRAVFVENISDARLITQIARETGTRVGGKLYSDALSSASGPAPSYAAMMRHNARLLTAAMSPAS